MDDLKQLETLILSHTENIDKLHEHISKVNEMLNDILENDPVYREQSAAAKETNRIKSATKQQIFKEPSAATLVSQINEAKTQMKELRTSLSNFLEQFIKLSGTNQIETADGQVREIVYSAKLVKLSSKFRP